MARIKKVLFKFKPFSNKQLKILTWWLPNSPVHDKGSGAGYYKINKTFNLGPFLSRTDYLNFDKIQNFEVMQYQ